MAQIVGKDYTNTQIVPILIELIKDESSEVKLNVVKGFMKIARVSSPDMLTASLIKTLTEMAKEGQWRVRMAVLELVAEMGFIFGKEVFCKHLQTIFMGYLTNTAASVREMGVEKSAILA